MPDPISQQSKKGHTCITSEQVGERHRSSGEQGLAPFFQANHDGQEQADSQDEAGRIRFWEQSQGAFVQ